MPTRKSKGEVQVPRLTQRLYTFKKAAEYFGRSVWSVKELIGSARLASVRIGRRIHLDFYDLDAFLEQNKVWEVL